MDQGKAQRVLAFPALHPARHHAPMKVSDEDPLSWPTPVYKAPQTQPQQGQEHSPAGSSTPNLKRIAVVLATSSSGANDGYEQGHDEDALGPVHSDLSGVGKHNIPASSMSQSQLTSQNTSQRSSPSAPVSSGRGRPRGWRPGMSYATMRGKSPNRSESSRAARTAKSRPHPHTHTSGEGKRRRGRPAKVSGTPPRDVYRKLSPPLVAFLCEWTGCKAELHNLDTLRRHVLAVHGRGDEVQCQWGRCGSGQPQSTQRLLDRGRFTTHMEQAHLVPMSWHVGDGPQNSFDLGHKEDTATEDVPNFLKDAHGNQVTPWVRYQEPEDQATWKSNRRKLKELLIQRNRNLPDRESSDEDRKQA